MSTQNRILGTVIVCVTVIVLSVIGLASDFVTRLLSSVDGLLLLMICLMMAGIFSLMLFVLAQEAGWLGKPHPVVASSSTPRPADQPVQANQATHPVAQAPARPAAEPAAVKSAIKAGEGK
jgi:predicted lipid-binding transport protein (Tim44 family)